MYWHRNIYANKVPWKCVQSNVFIMYLSTYKTNLTVIYVINYFFGRDKSFAIWLDMRARAQRFPRSTVTFDLSELLNQTVICIRCLFSARGEAIINQCGFLPIHIWILISWNGHNVLVVLIFSTIYRWK